jgi:F0F1-type ATP synthase membrane subunit a
LARARSCSSAGQFFILIITLQVDFMTLTIVYLDMAHQEHH